MYLLKINSLLFWATVYTMSQKTPPYNFLNNWVKNEPSWIILLHKIQRKLDVNNFVFVHLTCILYPPYLENSKKSFFSNKLSSVFPLQLDKFW